MFTPATAPPPSRTWSTGRRRIRSRSSGIARATTSRPEDRDRELRIEDRAIAHIAILDLQSSILDRESPVAQTDDDPDRVPEVVQPFSPGSGAQVIHLAEANG